MITLLHRQALQKMVQDNQPEAIQQMMKHFSVADQKQAKHVLARYLADRSLCSLQQCLAIYVYLLAANLNLYFNTFQQANQSLCKEKDFWLHIQLLQPLGIVLAHNRPYYRQTLIDTWLHQLTPGVPVEQIFHIFQIQELRSQLMYLLRSDSLYGWYLLIQKANLGDSDSAFLSKCCNYLLHAENLNQPQYVRQDVVQFMVLFFNHLPVHYPFRRQLDSTQIAYAESSFEAFCKVIIPAKRIEF